MRTGELGQVDRFQIVTRPFRWLWPAPPTVKAKTRVPAARTFKRTELQRQISHMFR